MRAILGSRLTILDATRSAIEWCRSELRISNPDYHKKLALGKWTGGTPETISLYERVGNELRLPFGAWRRFFHEFGTEIVFKAEYGPLRAFDYKSHINPYAYQEAAIKAVLKAKNGILVMPCGAGKTQTALEIIARVGGRCLWLTHTQDLLNQSMNRARVCFDCGDYGTITGGKVDIGAGITFATVQTMSKIDIDRYRDTWDIVVVDECHKAVGSPTRVMQFYKVLSALSCRYKIGLTATPKRADGLEKSMFALLGDVVYEVSRAEVTSTTCPVRVSIINTGWKPNLSAVLAGDGTINYSALIDDMIHDTDRYSVVLNTVENCCEKGSTLVLANRVEYLARLESDFKNGHRNAICLSALGNSKAAKAVRKEALRKLNDGEVDVVLATYQLAKEGLDVPNLRYVVFATPEKDETTVQQAAGRVGRKADGKEFGTIVDLVDDFGMFMGWARKRQRIYAKLY